MIIFLTIENGHVVAKWSGRNGGRMTRRLTGIKDARDFLRSKEDESRRHNEFYDVLSSSTLDFPHEYTSRKSTIALAREIRSR